MTVLVEQVVLLIVVLVVVRIAVVVVMYSVEHVDLAAPENAQRPALHVLVLVAVVKVNVLAVWEDVKAAVKESVRPIVK